MFQARGDRVETFDDWLDRYKARSHRDALTGEEIDQLYGLYMADWSVDSVVEHKALRLIGAPASLLADRVAEAMERRRGPAT